MNVSKPVDARYYYTISLKNIIHASTQIVETNPGTFITMIIIFGLYVFFMFNYCMCKDSDAILSGSKQTCPRLICTRKLFKLSYKNKRHKYVGFFFKYLLECLFLMYVYVHSLNSFHQYVQMKKYY